MKLWTIGFVAIILSVCNPASSWARPIRPLPLNMSNKLPVSGDEALKFFKHFRGAWGAKGKFELPSEPKSFLLYLKLYIRQGMSWDGLVYVRLTSFDPEKRHDDSDVWISITVDEFIKYFPNGNPKLMQYKAEFEHEVDQVYLRIANGEFGCKTDLSVPHL